MRSGPGLGFGAIDIYTFDLYSRIPHVKLDLGIDQGHYDHQQNDSDTTANHNIQWTGNNGDTTAFRGLENTFYFPQYSRIQHVLQH